MTEASGANLTGCPCESFTFGCCPDGVGISQGPNLEGCHLNCSSEHGCCPDGITPKVHCPFKENDTEYFFFCEKEHLCL